MLSLPPSMVLLVYVEIMNVRGGAGGSSSGVVVMVYMPQTTAPPTHVKSLAYTWRTYAQCEIFTFKAHIWSTQLQAFNCCYEHILSKFRPNTIDLLYMHTVYKTYIYFCWMCFNLPTHSNRICVSFRRSSLTNQPTIMPMLYAYTDYFINIFVMKNILIYFCGEFDLYAR